METLVDDLRSGRRVSDLRFDQVYPLGIRELSETHWTPVEVALRATKLLVQDERTRVLDVGAGSGKFCIVGSLFSGARFVGIEQRANLVNVAEEAAKALNATEASFVLGNMADLDWRQFDAFYLFNPFYENKVEFIRIDETVPHSSELFRQYVEIVRSKLRHARPGTKVVTYHGFGGNLPFGYSLVERVPISTGCLELWIRLEIPRSVRRAERFEIC